MKVGTLCRVKSKSSHSPTQYNDKVVVTHLLGENGWVGGLNLRTGKEHHYNGNTELEPLWYILEATPTPIPKS
jgi:hypothetical protein